MTSRKWLAGPALGVVVGVVIGGLLASTAMAELKLDMRFGTTNAVAVTAPNQVVTAEFWATAVGYDGNPANDTINKVQASFVSSNGGLILGNLTDALHLDNTLTNGPALGPVADLDGDGDNDIGSTNVSSANDWFLAKAATGVQVASPVHIASVTFNGAGWGADAHGVTELWAIPRSHALGAVYNQDGVTMNGLSAVTGTKVVLYRPATADAGAEVTIDIGQTKPFDGSATVGTVGTFEWDVTGDGVADFTGEKPDVSYSALRALGLVPGNSYTVTLTTVSPYTTSTDTTTLNLLPEPATMVLLAIGAGLTLVRRRRA